jgi:glycosyltransferase involved in cell wall biosynthesis
VRVLQLVTGLATDGPAGGAEQFALHLAQQLDPAAFDVWVAGLWQYGTPGEAEWLARLEAGGQRGPLLAVPTGRGLADMRSALRALWPLLAEFKPSVVNSHGEQADLLAALAALFHPSRPKVVRTMHTDQQWQARPWLGRLLLPWVFPVVFHREVAISQAVRAALDRRWLARVMGKRAELIYNGIDSALFDSQPRSAPPGLDPQRPRLGIVARLTRQKGHADLLKAFALLRRAAPARLLVMGDGPLGADLRQLAIELGIDKSVDFLGNRPDALAIMASLDLLISASLWEGVPTVLLEAMALSVPVVATSVSGSTELVENGATGLIVPPGQPAELAAAMQSQLSDSGAARRMAQAARERARSYTIQRAAKEYSALYMSLLSRPEGA